MATAGKKSATKKAAAPKKSSEAAERKQPRGRKLAGLPLDTKLKFGLINENLKEGEEGFGKRYTAAVGPRREGTKVAENWAKLKNGMTIRQAREADIPAGTITKSLKKGWLEAVLPPGSNNGGS